nr:isochorismatase family protein [Chania multitudinisentens]
MKSALLIIDVQKGLFVPPPAEADAVIARINQLSERARQAGVPVIFIQHQTAHDELLHGSDAWQIHPDLQVKASDHRVEKTTPAGCKSAPITTPHCRIFTVLAFRSAPFRQKQSASDDWQRA